MAYQIKVFHLTVNGEERFLAYLNTFASDASVSELNEAFNDINESLTQEFKDSDIQYDRQKLRLYYIKRSDTKFILWYPENGDFQETIDFIHGFKVPKVDPITIIEFDEITVNFPHIFWTEEDLAISSQDH